MAENHNMDDEQIFNEDELQDIMSEFEDLEREYQEQAPESQLAAVEEVSSSVEESVEDTLESEVETDNVVSFTSASKNSTTSTPNAPNGVTMTLELPIGEQVAQIGISPEYGFSFTMDGVELTIDAQNGCVMTLPGGMTFNIPVQNNQKQKKSA